jgi:hypothetical protein
MIGWVSFALNCPVMCLERSLLFHLWIGVFPSTDFSHINLTISENPSRHSHPSWNLNGRLCCEDGDPVDNKMGAWSDKASIWGRTRIETSGNLNSQSESINTRYNFSYVGSGRLFTQVNFLPTIDTSLRSRLSMTTSNKKGHLPLLFSWGYLSKLKSPSMMIGCGLSFARLTNSQRKAGLAAS